MQETLLAISQQQQQQQQQPPTGSNQKQKEIDEGGEIQLLIPTRGRLLASRTRSQPSSRRVTPSRGDIAFSSDRATESDELLAVLDVEQEKKEEVNEKQVLPNGDTYTGSLPGGLPHGTGKYLWLDGCMYEGEWSRGRASGYGRFSWPSGATYEGHFKSGRMDGLGTFVGVHGDSFKGSWLSDRKHGFGEKRYPNGDVYRGYWKSNLRDGQGSYRWSNGNEYVGQWRNGVIHGKGLMVWATGNTYEGCWENGVPLPKAKEKGFFFTLANANGKTDFCSNYYTSDLLGNFGNQDPRKRSSVDTKIPRICIWELDGDAGDITCDIVDNFEASMLYVDADGDGNYAKEFANGGVAEAGQLQRSPCTSFDGEVKKPRQTISRGHKNYDLVLKLQLGIRYSVGKHASIMRELKQSDFDPKEKFWTRFPPEGSKFTPPHQSVDFRWKDYCPMVFKHLRELFAIDPADYMLAICGNDTLSEFSSPGKSGSFFYLTQDDRFMVKTVKKSEVKVLIRMLPSYYQHVCQFKNSLVTKFFGVHCVKPVGGQKTRFIVMGNLFCSDYRIHKRFDLKGSSYGRITDKDGGEIDETTTLKDLDLNYVFHLERSWFQELIRQINRDCEFLEAEGIMDYSLLIGIHFCDDHSGDEMKASSNNLTFEEANMKPEEKSMRGYHLLPNMDWVMEDQGTLIRLGVNMPARAEYVSRVELDHCTGAVSCSGHGELFEVILCFGIIDILQDYDISKKLEHAYKSLQVDPTCISAVDPKLYSKRFRDFIHRIFVEIGNESHLKKILMEARPSNNYTLK